MIERLRVGVPAGAAEEFSSAELTLCADSCWVLVPPHVTTVARKRHGYSAKSAVGRLHLNTHTPLAQQSRSGLTMLSIDSVRTYQGKRAHTQLVGEHSATVVLAR